MTLREMYIIEGWVSCVGWLEDHTPNNDGNDRGVTGTGPSTTLTRRPLQWPGSSPDSFSNIRQETPLSITVLLLTPVLSRSARSPPGTESGASRRPGPAGSRDTLIGTLAGREWEWTGAEIRKVTGISGQQPTNYIIGKLIWVSLENILCVLSGKKPTRLKDLEKYLVSILTLKTH